MPGIGSPSSCLSAVYSECTVRLLEGSVPKLTHEGCGGRLPAAMESLLLAALRRLRVGGGKRRRYVIIWLWGFNAAADGHGGNNSRTPPNKLLM